MTPAGTSNELDFQNEWEENTHTHIIYDNSVIELYCNKMSSYSYALSVFSSHLFWTSSSFDVPAGVTQEEGHTGFLIHLPSAVRALIFPARRIQPSLSLVNREVEFYVLTIQPFSAC